MNRTELLEHRQALREKLLPPSHPFRRIGPMPMATVRPSADSTLISAEDIVLWGDSQGISILTWDSVYVPITQASFEEQGGAHYRNLEKLGLAKYQEEAWDCDKFARMMAALICASFARTSGHPKAGVLVGVWVYQPDASAGYHAIVCGVRREASGVLNWMWIEPQTGWTMQLSETEIMSCMGVWL